MFQTLHFANLFENCDYESDVKRDIWGRERERQSDIKKYWEIDW